MKIKNPAILKKIQELEEKKMLAESKSSPNPKRERQVIGWTAIVQVGKIYGLVREVSDLTGKYHMQYTDDEDYLVGVIKERIFDDEKTCMQVIEKMKSEGWRVEATKLARIWNPKGEM